MPILLEEDRKYPLPALYRVRQRFDPTCLKDIQGTIRKELNKPGIRKKIFPGARIALAVGSRGIRNLSLIVKTVIDTLKSMGADPFIIAAMGSHGGGTVEGQLEILYGYGITPEAMQVPVLAENDVLLLGKTRRNQAVYFDRRCFREADLIVPINRVKLHTDFVDTIQSGLCKMLTIGMGHHKGCSSLHEADFSYLGETIKEAASIVLSKAPVGFGVAILENAYDMTFHIEAVAAEELLSREEALVVMAKEHMPRLMIPEIDVLVVEQIGKDISGAGYDPNILGRSYILKEFSLPVPHIKRMVLLDLTGASHGNAIGMGAFDVITRRVFDQLDFEAIYANSIAIKVLDDCKIPLIARDETEAIRVAIKVLRDYDPSRLKIVKIKDTLHLEEIQVSEALLDQVRDNPDLELIREE